MTDFKIRSAKYEDCTSIMKLIQELAIYDKMPDAPKINHKTLEEDGFGEHSFYKCFVAEASTENGKEIVGYGLYFFSYSISIGKCIYMEDLYVTPKHRHRGIGKSLWGAIVKEGLEHMCEMINFSVLGWNTSSIDFYENMKAYNRTKGEKVHLLRLTKKNMTAFVKA